MSRTYRMTAEQSTEWTAGGEAAQAVAQEIQEDIQADGITDDVDVLVDDGTVAWSIWQTV